MFQGQGKVREFWFYSGKMETLKKSGKCDLGQGKLGILIWASMSRRLIPSYHSAVIMFWNIGLSNCIAILRNFETFFICTSNIFVVILYLKKEVFLRPTRVSFIPSGKIKVWSGKGQGKVREFGIQSCVATMIM